MVELVKQKGGVLFVHWCGASAVLGYLLLQHGRNYMYRTAVCVIYSQGGVEGESCGGFPIPISSIGKMNDELDFG